MKLSKEIQQKLICPSTKAKLRINGNYLENVADPTIRYPIINDIPILINTKNSIFNIDDFEKKRNTTFNLHESKVKKLIKRNIPKISKNIKAKKNYNELITLLPNQAKILIIGGSIEGQGMEVIYSNESFETIGTDVSFGPLTKVVSDAHEIPFEDETFDAVIIQAVLEHILDPHRCVNEIYRVLKSLGIVYSETPFMQQVHMKQYDFTRYTHLGLCRLFRRFEEIRSGPCGGPGMALASAYIYFLRSITKSIFISKILTILAYYTSFFFKYIDYFIIDNPGSYDAAYGYYFMGKKSNNILADKELIKQFKGVK